MARPTRFPGRGRPAAPLDDSPGNARLPLAGRPAVAENSLRCERWWACNQGTGRLDQPHFCARRSRLALSRGVAEWIFALSEGLVGYSAADYDQLARLRW